MTTFEQIGEHYIREVQQPSSDSEQWMAYLCLKHLYPSILYWSMDGYHVHAIVDYEKNMLWEEDRVMSSDRSETLRGVKNFYHCTTQEIVLEWGSTVKSHRQLI